jgi:RNA polymerase Rpb1 C-terminal repeat
MVTGNCDNLICPQNASRDNPPSVTQLSDQSTPTRNHFKAQLSKPELSTLEHKSVTFDVELQSIKDRPPTPATDIFKRSKRSSSPNPTYSPTSPMYSPTSPAYSPNSPQYSPSSPRYSPSPAPPDHYSTSTPITSIGVNTAVCTFPFQNDPRTSQTPTTPHYSNGNNRHGNSGASSAMAIV